MNKQVPARDTSAGARIAPDWHPKHVTGSIEDVCWTDWSIDQDRPLADLARAHLRNCRDRSLGRKTVEGYDAFAASFIRFVETEKRVRPAFSSSVTRATVRDLETQTLYRYLQRSAARGGSVSLGAQQSEGSALRAIANFGITIGAVRPDALRAFVLPKPDRDAAPTTLSDAEILRLLAHLAKDTSYEGVRLNLECRLATDTGVRPAELAGIDLPEINRAEQSIAIRGKGAKNRTVFFGDGTAKVLDLYLRVRGESRSERLFLGHRGSMGPEGLSKAFRAVADGLGLVTGARRNEDGSDATLYVLRRTFARRFADNGGTVEDLARLMGHEPSSIPMLLKVYYRPSDERLRRAHRRVRPLDALLGEAA